MATAIAVVTIVGCSSAREAPIEYTSEIWSAAGIAGRRYLTEHFEIISTLSDAEFETALPEFLETAYRRYAAVLPLATANGDRLTTYVFASRPEWTRFTRQRYPARSEIYARIGTGGFTERTTSVSFYRSRSTTLATLAHEGWHQYVGALGDVRIPAWLDEGLACYHETVDFSGGSPGFTPQHNTFRVNTLRDAIRSDKLLSLSEIVNTNAERIIAQEPSETVQIYYAQTWALVTFLRHGGRGRYASSFDHLLGDIGAGTFGARLSARRVLSADQAESSLGEIAFSTYFQADPDDLADEYFDHLVRTAGF